MKQQPGCIFCRIARGEAPAARVFEDELTAVFMDVNPASDGHALVIVKAHFENVLEIDEEAVAAVAVTTRRVARAIDRALTPDGIRIAQFNGSAAGQSVFHYHVHLVPMQAGRQVSLHGRGPGDRKRIEAIAARIRAAVEV